MPIFRRPGPGEATARGGTKTGDETPRLRRFVHTLDAEVYEAQQVLASIAAHYLWDAALTCRDEERRESPPHPSELW